MQSEKVLDKVMLEIRTRHYSNGSEKVYPRRTAEKRQYQCAKMRGLGKKLRSGKMVLVSKHKQILMLSSQGEVVAHIHYDSLKPNDWGYVYECYVGQVFEKKGYEVDYRGLSTGFNDNGIDLIAKNDSEKLFVQCKYTTKKKLSKQSIEWILYKASSFLASQYEGQKLNYCLVVPSLSSAFSKKKKKYGKEYFPMVEYFLFQNGIQSKVMLQIKEIEMQC